MATRATRASSFAAKWSATDRRDQEFTRRAAERHKDAWTEDEDRYVLDRAGTTVREVALALGRTAWAVRQRRWKLRRHAATAGETG